MARSLWMRTLRCIERGSVGPVSPLLVQRQFAALVSIDIFLYSFTSTLILVDQWLGKTSLVHIRMRPHSTGD
jgi:hypothetical protein